MQTLEGNLTPAEIRSLEVPVIELSRRGAEASAGIAAKCAELEAALLQCQGLQDATDAQAGWLAQAEAQAKYVTYIIIMANSKWSWYFRE